MQLIEKALVGKTGKPEECEDFILFTPNFAAVIDGVTGKTDEMQGTGRIAGKILIEAIEMMEKDISMETCLEFLTSKIYNYYCKKGIEAIAKEDPRKANVPQFFRFERKVVSRGFFS